MTRANRRCRHLTWERGIDLSLAVTGTRAHLSLPQDTPSDFPAGQSPETSREWPGFGGSGLWHAPCTS